MRTSFIGKKVRIFYIMVKMVEDKPEIATVSSKGQITIPSEVRKEFGLEKGDKVLFFPTEHGIILKKMEIPTVEEFERMVEESDRRVELSLKEISDIVHERRRV